MKIRCHQLFFEITGAISWDGSFDWPKRSDAINKTRPNDAPPSQLAPNLHSA